MCVGGSMKSPEGARARRPHKEDRGDQGIALWSARNETVCF